ncbi:hypothetical protein L1987_62153 [Smallanthus sonchifolius]|uniref:Uncharacterized protein n=1 Tax=Smallanthus sonchifolius TaxID=185202 RepID=A0ACB9C9M5_9ASTR|nr:hypothetical protein L1987_62153 [Smallanthus sonchifolius]
MASETTKNHHLHTCSSSSHYTYDLFLSFKGKDTGKNFIDHLYLALTQSGIHTFRHDYKLSIGNDRDLEIPKAIQESRVSIIVFSKDYVFTGRCLDELVNILDCKESNGQVVLPVYYKIDPAQIHEQTMTFGISEKGLAMDIKKVERWRVGLAQVANLPRWDLQNITNGPEAKFIKQIVRHVPNEHIGITLLRERICHKRVLIILDDIDQILKKLRISFDALDDDKMKDIFLDIACFFIGMDKDYAIDIFDGCGFFPVVGVTILIERCLLRIGGNNKLRMHDLVRDMGREVVREKFPFEPGKRSRLWFHEDATRVISKDEGSKAIEGLVLNQQKPMHLNTKTFAIMQKLRLLQINNVHLHGSFQGLFTELRWLCWHHCPLESLPTDLHPRKLVALDMQHSNLKTWNGMKFLTNLKRLNLSNSKFLRTTLDFSGVPKLDELSLRFCSSLLELDPSIGHLGTLTELNLGYCENLKSLPKSICNLRSLERLYLDECTNLDELPEKVGNMESLQELHATGTAISQLPDSIGLLKQLKNVSLAQSNRYTKANPWFSFLPLQIFSQTKTKIKFLPPTVSTLSSIKDIDLSDSNLSDADIPHDLSQLSSLGYLHLNGNKFRSLPSRLSQLRSLKHLWLNDCMVLQSIAEFPPNLRTLDASNCPLLEKLPDLSNLKYLECLDFSNCSSLVVLQGLQNIKSIKEIYLEGCSNLTTSFEESLFQGYSEGVVNRSIFLSRRGIPSWFSHKKVGSFISFDVPSGIETEFLEMTLWVDYVNEGKHAVGLKATIKNKTNETEWTYEANFFRTFEVNSWVSNGPQPYPLRSGDMIEVYVGGDTGLKIEKCGIHLAYKTDIKTTTQSSQAMVETESKNLDFIHEKRGHGAVQTSCELSNENRLSKRLKLE